MTQAIIRDMFFRTGLGPQTNGEQSVKLLRSRAFLPGQDLDGW